MKEFELGNSITLTPPKPTKANWDPIENEGYFYDLVAEQTNFSPRRVTQKQLIPFVRRTYHEALELGRDMQEYSRLKQYQYLNDLLSDGTVWTPDWSNDDQDKYYLAFSPTDQKYLRYNSYTVKTASTVFFSKQAIDTLIVKLNNGTINFRSGKGCIA
jgi:hypothetical protein